MTRRETVGPVKVNLGFHEASVAVVCQEGCYPDKKAHVNQDCFACKPLFHEEGDAAKQMLIGVFDGHGPNGEHCASIAAHARPQLATGRACGGAAYCVPDSQSAARKPPRN